jgi:HK97 family phage major capsid protein
VRIPKLGGPIADPGFTGENELIPERDVDFDEVLLMPETMQSCKTLTRFSNELARQSIIALDSVLQQRLVKDVADVLDHAFLHGAGNAGEAPPTSPLGLLSMAGVQSMATVGNPTLDDLHDADALVLGADVEISKVRWLMSSRDFIGLRKLKDLQNRYQIQPDPTVAGGVGTNESSIILCDFSQVAIARDLAPSVKVLDLTFAAYDQQALRVVCRYDIGALNSEAIIVMRGVTAAA